MLSACLLLSSALLLPQDDAAAPATSDSVRAFLTEVADTLYDPVDNGLESLSFDLPLRVPMGPGEPVDLSTVSVDWAKDRDPVFDVRANDNLPPMLTQGLQAQGMTVDGMSIAMAQQPLLQALNRGFDVDGMLSTNDAVLGTADGQVSVTFTPKPEFAASIPIQEFTWFFDDDLMPTRKVSKMEQQSAMGAMSVTITEDHIWRDTGAGLLLETVRATQDFGMMQVTTSRSTEYEQFGEVLMLVSYTEKMDGVAGMIPASTTTVVLENVTVNGATAGAGDEVEEVRPEGGQ